VYLDDLFLNKRPCTAEETVLFVCINVMFSFLNISMGFTLVVTDLHLCEKELHIVGIIVNSECCKDSFRYELLTLLCLKGSNNNVFTDLTNY
jgi:hypothetical protein